MPADAFVRDLRVGARLFAKEKSFCTLATIVLSLGICAVTTMFSVVDGVMLRGFSFPNASRVMSVDLIDPSKTNAFGVDGQVSAMDFEEFLPVQASFDAMAAYISGATVNVTVDKRPRRYTGAYVTERFLSLLGVGPMLGRDFGAGDNRPGAEKVALISYGVWQRDFGGTPAVVGSTVRVNGTTATIVGVMPRGFNFPTNEDLWIPLYSEYPVRPRNDPRSDVTNPAVIGLLKPGGSAEQASVEFTGIARRFAAAYPDTNKRFNAGFVQPLIRTFTPTQLRGVLLTMLGFCLGVLLIACVNVMNMQFARATLRAKELAVRSSLGATRGRLVRQMLAECLLLASIGAVIGIALAYVAIHLLDSTLHNLDNPVPSWMTFRLDLRALAFAVVATLTAAIVSGLLPAWMSSRANVVETLKEGGRGNTSRGINLATRGLVVLQVVVTCVLLIGSLLQLRSILKQQAIDYGYPIDALLTARMGLMDGDYPTPEARRIFYDRLERELREEPAFERVALTNRFRMVFSGSGAIEVEGKTYKLDSDRPTANFEQVTGDFFDVTGQKLIEGRTFNEEDLDQRQPLAIVNAAFARRHFGNGSALGRRFRTFGNSASQVGPWRTIVGVVTDVRMLPPFNLPNVDETGFYLPFYARVFGPVSPEPFVNQFATVVVKPRGGVPADRVVHALRRGVSKVDPNLPLYFVGTPKQNLDGFVAPNRIIAMMFSIFGVVAVILASVGIYGVMSFAVNQRTQEFGLRMALGADRGRILGMVLRQSTIQVALGVALGLGIALPTAILGGPAIQNALFSTSPRDPLTYASVVGLIVAVALAATLVPARRATRVDPMVALRAE